jgi:hypothetical protein
MVSTAPPIDVTQFAASEMSCIKKIHQGVAVAPSPAMACQSRPEVVSNDASGRKKTRSAAGR